MVFLLSFSDVSMLIEGVGWAVGWGGVGGVGGGKNSWLGHPPSRYEAPTQWSMPHW